MAKEPLEMEGLNMQMKKGREIYFTSLKVVQTNEIVDKNGGTIHEKKERFFFLQVRQKMQKINTDINSLKD